MKKIWIFNQYATEMFYSQGGRHHWISKYLIREGKQPLIFCANTRHNSTDKVFTNKNLFKEEVKDTVPYLFIKSSNYKKNGFSRILNMMIFYKNLLRVAKRKN